MDAAEPSMFAPENRAQLEASFRAFLARPENRPLAEEQQRAELAATLELREREADERLRAQMLALPLEDQRALRPVLRHGVLRRLLQSLCSPEPDGDGHGDGHGDGQGDGHGDGQGDGHGNHVASGASPPSLASPEQPVSLATWVANPRVVGLLRNAAKALRCGDLREEELERLLLGQLQGSCGAEVGGATSGGGSSGRGAGHARVAGAALAAQAACAAVLPSQLLAEALDEHLQERRAGVAAYKAGCAVVAAEHFSRASAIAAVIRGASPEEQAEVTRCLARALWGEAAARMALGERAAAEAACTRALAALRGCLGGSYADGSTERPQPLPVDANLEARVLLRRAKARLAAHKPQAALEDLAEAEALDASTAPETTPLRERARRAAAARAPGGASEARMAIRMLRGLSLDDGCGGGGARQG